LARGLVGGLLPLMFTSACLYSQEMLPTIKAHPAPSAQPQDSSAHNPGELSQDESPTPKENWPPSGEQRVVLEPALVDTSIAVPLIDFRGARIADIMSALAKQYHLNIVVDPAIEQTATIRLENARLYDVLIFLIKEYGLKIERDGALLKIMAPKAVTGPPLRRLSCADGLLTLDVKDIEVGDLARALTDSCGMNIVPHAGAAGKVSGYVREVPFEFGLRNVLNSNGFDLIDDNGILNIVSLSAPAGGGPAVPGIYLKNDRISLNVSDASLRGVIDNIADRLNLRIFIYGPIEGTVTARCGNLTAFEALDRILWGTKYTFSFEDSTYFVGPSTMSEITVSRLVRLKHIMAQGVIEMIPESMAAKAVLKLAREHNGVMVTGPIQIVNGIEDYISEIDVTPAQILIEALVVDYNITDRTEYGIRATSFPLGDSSRQGQSYYPDIDVSGSSEELNRDIRHWADKFGIAGVGTLPEEFYVRLSALAREGKANVRSRPRIATLNGHEAKIDVGTTQYYLLKTETTYGVGQQTPTSQVTEKFQTIEASMSLTITPWVNASNEILVTIHPEFNTPQGSFNANVPPTINHRILDSTVRLHDGETIVLGGLIQTSENETVEKFPILGDIPVLGWLFKNKSKIKTNSELVIYLTPHIYYGSEGAVDVSKLKE